MKIGELDQIAKQIRANVLRATTAAGSGHPTSCLSAVDLMTGLMFGGTFHADLAHPKNDNNDRLIFSKGHAAPLLYALYRAAGKISDQELMKLRKFGSPLEGHPMPGFPYTEVPTGSLGQGLSTGLGMTLAGRLGRLGYFTYVLLGDGEMAEGSVWEAIQLAGFLKADKLVAVIDVNRLGQTGPTMLGHNVAAYARRVGAFGWRTIIVDGHDLKAIQAAYQSARRPAGKPTMIIAKTIKGQGVSFLANKNGWHGKPLNKEQLKKALIEIDAPKKQIIGRVAKPASKKMTWPAMKLIKNVEYKIGAAISPRQALDNALYILAGRHPNSVALDGEVKNSTITEKISEKKPKQYIEGYIAEQNMVGMAMGLASRGFLPITATFTAFLTRAHDQIRMAQYADKPMVFVGTHAGVHIGADGPSQMGLEDIAMFRALNNSTVLYPADATATGKLMAQAIGQPGITYVRITRATLPVIYPANTKLTIGGSFTWCESKSDRATIVAAGITLHEARRAAELLAKQKINVRVVDLYSVKPIDTTTLRRAARQTKQIIVAEDHRPEGGMAEAVRTALGNQSSAVTSLAVNKTPHSGRPEQLLRQQAIDAEAIIKTVKRIINK